MDSTKQRAPIDFSFKKTALSLAVIFLIGIFTVIILVVIRGGTIQNEYKTQQKLINLYTLVKDQSLLTNQLMIEVNNLSDSVLDLDKTASIFENIRSNQSALINQADSLEGRGSIHYDDSLKYLNKHFNDLSQYLSNLDVGKYSDIEEVLNAYQGTLVELNSSVKSKLNGFNAEESAEMNDLVLYVSIAVLLSGAFMYIFAFIIIRQSSFDLVEARMIAEKEKLNALESAKVKSEFLSTMSHEIRTPLTGILGLVRILKQNDPKKDQISELNLLQYSGEHLLSIINDILDFNKIEAGRIKLENLNFNLHVLVSTIADTMRQRALEKGIDFQLIYDPNLPKVYFGDSVRIGQVINNLASNAVKFTEEGKVTLRVQFGGFADDKLKLKIDVSDTGIGISQENISKIFEQFVQEQNSYNRKYGGSGLGLTIVQNLLQMMGSRLKVSSTPNKGSKFSFTLELLLGNENLAHNPSTESTLHSLKSFNINVLVAEDNSVNFKILSSLLKQIDVNYDYAENGKIAVEMAADNRYDLIFMDLQMPQMNGFDASILIKKASLNQQTPIIALSASVLDSTRNKAKESGMEDYITKPFTPVQIYNMILYKLGLNVKEKFEDQLVTIPDDNIPEMEEIIISLAGEEKSAALDLTNLIVRNYEELKNTVEMSVEENDIKSLKGIIHKNKPTLTMLKLSQLQSYLQELVENMDVAPLQKDKPVVANLLSEIQDILDKLSDIKKKAFK